MRRMATSVSLHVAREGGGPFRLQRHRTKYGVVMKCGEGSCTGADRGEPLIRDDRHAVRNKRATTPRARALEVI